jgi:TPR repeat protein
MRKALAMLVLTMGVFAVSALADAAQTDIQAQISEVAETRARAERGDADAQYRLGRIYAKGEDVLQDYMLAVEWFRKAAEQGNAKGQNAMGTMYANGSGVPQDYVQAIAWYRKAAEQGEMMAQANLGVMYDTGRGVPKDFTQAGEWYRKAAAQGYALAQCNLGVMYDNGQGVPQNDAQAVVLYRKAAEQGFGMAQYNLGGMYGDGRGGLPQDNVEALKWLFLAAAGATGEELQKFADRLDKRAKMMPPAQVQESTRRALEWTEASKRRLAAQVDAEPKPPALQITELMVAPRTVRPGQPFSLEIAYTATDPAAASRKAAVNMSLSILSDGSALLDMPAEIVESDTGQPWKITKPLTAATTPGAYLIRVRLVLGSTVVTRDVEFEITR